MKENNYRNHPEYEKKIDKNFLIIGGAVIAVAGVGAYYIYSRNKLLNEFKYWILEYQREYEEFMEDGVITPEEQEQLDVKRLYLDALMHDIEDKGLIEQARELALTLGFLFIAWKAIAIIHDIMKRYFDRHPPRPGQSDQYQDPYDFTWHYSPDELADHIEDTHPVQDAPGPLYDVWTQIQLLPEWIIEWLKDSTTNFKETWERGWDNTPEWTHVVLIAALAITIALLLIISLGTLAPTLQPVINAIAIAMAI